MCPRAPQSDAGSWLAGGVAASMILQQNSVEKLDDAPVVSRNNL